MPKSLYVDPDKMRAEGKITFKDIPINVYKKSVKEEVEEGNYTKEDLLRIYRDMSICREFEDMLNQIKTQAKYADVETTYPGPAHLSLGQEAAAVGEAYLLGKEDFTFGSHRSHSEILAKGLSCIQKLSDKELMDTMENFFDGKTLKAIQTVSKAEGDVKELAIEFLVYGALAELFARENGFHKGLGGSMHAFFLPFGIYPNNALVGGSATIATGASLFKKCNDKDGVVVANLGDGSMGRGPVWEALSFATMDQYRTLWEEGRKGGLPLTACARFFSINHRAPVTIFLLPGIFPLVPGAGIYYTAYYFLQGKQELFASKGGETFKVALALALGIALVCSVPLPSRHDPRNDRL